MSVSALLRSAVGSILVLGIMSACSLPACSGNQPHQDIVVQPSATARAGACGDVGCVNALVIEIEGVAFESGPYTLELDGDGRQARCSFTLPTRSELDETCDGELHVSLQPQERGMETVGVTAVLLSSSPSQVRVTIARGGTHVAELTSRPDYAVLHPNGAGCTPTCRTGELRMSAGR
jgi:hypothetical protein